MANENPKHGISLDYVKAVNAVKNKGSAARKGGISLDYISNITGGRERDAVKSTFAAPKVSSSEPSGTSSASLKMSPINKKTRSVAAGAYNALGNIVNNIDSMTKPQLPTAAGINNEPDISVVKPGSTGLTAEKAEKGSYTPNMNPNTPGVARPMTDVGTGTPSKEIIKPGSMGDTAKKASGNTYTPNTVPNRYTSARQITDTGNSEMRYLFNSNETDAIRWRVENELFNPNQPIDWKNDPDATMVSDSLKRMIEEEKEKQEVIYNNIEKQDDDVAVYGYQIELGKSPEEAYEQMLFTCYPDGGAPYTSVDDFVQQYEQMLSEYRSSKEITSKMEAALESRSAAEKITKSERTASIMEEKVARQNDFQNIAMSGMKCKDLKFDFDKDYYDTYKNAREFEEENDNNFSLDYSKIKSFEDNLENPVAYVYTYRANKDGELIINEDIWSEGTTRYFGIATPEYCYFNEDEALIYTYYVETEGREKADEYMQSIMHRLQQRREEHRAISSEKTLEDVKKWAEENRLAAAAFSFGTNLIGGVQSLGGMIGGRSDGPSFLLSDTTQALRAGSTEGYSDTGKFFSNVGYSIGDNLVAAAFGPSVAPAVMASTATGNAYNNAIKSGSSEQEAREYALLTGLIEWGTEKIPFDKLLKLSESGVTFSKDDWKPAIKAILGQSGCEAAEETVNSYASTLMDISVRGENSDYKQYIRHLVEQGASIEEAEKQANEKFFIWDPLESAAAGAISGSVMSTGQIGVNTAAQHSNTDIATLVDKINNGETLTVKEKKKLLNADSLFDKMTFEKATGLELPTDYSRASAMLDAYASTAAKNKIDTESTTTLESTDTAESIDSIGHTDSELQTIQQPDPSVKNDPRFEGLRAEIERAETEKASPSKIESFDNAQEITAPAEQTAVQRNAQSEKQTITDAYESNDYADALETARMKQEDIYGSDLVRNAGKAAEILSKGVSSQGTVPTMHKGGITLDIENGQSITSISMDDIAEYSSQNPHGVSRNVMSQMRATEAAAASRGIPVYWYDGRTTPVYGHNGEAVNGFRHKGPDGEYIAIDINSTAPLLFVFGHEMFHAMGKESEAKLTKYLSDYLGEELSIEQAADKLGENLCDPTFCEYLVNKNRTLAQKVLDFIKDFIARLKGENVKQLNSMQKTLADALHGYINSNGDNKISAGTSRNSFMSIAQIVGHKGDYGQGVVLDTDFFKGVKPRDWSKKLSDHVYKNMAGAQLVVYDNNGRPETITLAKTTDRVKKDGANNSHKVLDKLARTNGDNIKALGVLHIDELANTSRYENATDEHSHQWLDENGWEYRKAYAIDKSGNIYEVTLNIARGRGRNILYALNNIRRIDDGVVPSTRKGRGSHININPSYTSIPNPDDDVNNSFMSRSSLTDIGDGVSVKNVDAQTRAERNKRFAAEYEFINRIARRTRTKVQYVSSIMQDGKALNGGCYYHRPSGTLYLNVNSEKALSGVFYRGLLHHLAENDTRFVQTTYSYVREFGKDAGWKGNVIDQINEVLTGRTDTTQNASAFEEVFADKVAEMFEDENFMRYVSRKNMTFLQKLWENIKNFIIRSLGGTYTPPADVVNAKTAEEIIGKMSDIQVLVADALDRQGRDRTRAAKQAVKEISKTARKLDGKYAELNGESYTERDWQDYDSDRIEHEDVTVVELRERLRKMPSALLDTLSREMGYTLEGETATARRTEFAENVLSKLHPEDIVSVPNMPYREGDISPLTSKAQKQNISSLKKTGTTKTARRYGYQNVADGVMVYVTDSSKVPLSNAHADNLAAGKNLAGALGFDRIGYYTGDIRNINGREVKTESQAVIGKDGTLYINLNADSPYTAIVGASWFENLRKTDPRTAAALIKAYDRYRKLTRSKADISQWIGKQLTGTQKTSLFTGDRLFTEELSALMHMDASTILGVIEADSQFSSLIARGDPTLVQKITDSIKGFFTKFGDVIARMTGHTDSRAASALTIAQKNLLIAMRDAHLEGARAMRDDADAAAEYRRIQAIEREIERIDRLEAERERAAQQERADRRRDYHEELDRQEAEKNRTRENRRKWNWGDIPDGEGGGHNSFMSREVDNENGESYNQNRGDNNGRVEKDNGQFQSEDKYDRRGDQQGDGGDDAQVPRESKQDDRGGTQGENKNDNRKPQKIGDRHRRLRREVAIEKNKFILVATLNDYKIVNRKNGSILAYKPTIPTEGNELAQQTYKIALEARKQGRLQTKPVMCEGKAFSWKNGVATERGEAFTDRHSRVIYISSDAKSNHVDKVRFTVEHGYHECYHAASLQGMTKDFENCVQTIIKNADSYFLDAIKAAYKEKSHKEEQAAYIFGWMAIDVDYAHELLGANIPEREFARLYNEWKKLAKNIWPHGIDGNNSFMSRGDNNDSTGLGTGFDDLNVDNAEAAENAIGRFEQNTEESQTSENSPEPAPIINEEPEVRSKYQELRDRFGTIPQGEDVNSRGDVGVPSRTEKSKRVRQGVRTFAEAKATPDEVVGELEREIVNGTFSYTPLSDKAANNYAKEMIEADPEEALREWDAVVRGTKPATKKQIALAENLIMEAAALGDTETAVRLIAEVAAEGTRAGQAVQAFRMVKRLSPMGQLLSLQKAIDKLNRENENRDAKKIEIPKEDLQEFIKLTEELKELNRQIARAQKALRDLNDKDKANTEADFARRAIEVSGKGKLHDAIDTMNDKIDSKKKKLDALKDELMTKLAAQMPKKWTEKFNAWRYLSMLGNLRTHTRNFLGNLVFAPTVTLKSKIAAVLEMSAKKIKPNSQFERAQSLTAPKAIKDFAKKDAQSYLKQLAEGGKYNVVDEIRRQQKPFSEKNPVGRALNKAAAFNSAMLEVEDGIFLRGRYAYALARYCAANKWNVAHLNANPQDLQRAREFAFREAQRATYRDMNAFSQFLSRASNKLRDGKGFSRMAYWAMEGAMPFKKTPANIIKRGVEYSPLGLLNTLTVDTFRLKRGEITGAEYINNLAAGMTGTMVLGLGYLLASLGVLRGRNKDDEDEFEKLRGAQEWSVVIGDFSYTVDWLAPMSLPLFVGVELYDQTANSNDKMDMQDFLDSLTAISEPIFSLSMMDGVQSLLQSYSSEGAISDMFISALQSYAGQMTPTILGQIARTLDDTSRNAYYNDKTSWWSNTVMQPIRSAMSKTPVLEEQLPARVDAWGRTTDGTTSFGGRFVQNFLSPGYWSFDKTTPVDEEIQKIYDEIGDNGVLPDTAPKQFSYDGETYYLSSKEYVSFAVDRGQTAYAIIEDLINTKTYKTLPAKDRADAIKKAYDIALDYAKGNTESGFDAESNKAIKVFNESGVEYSDYILFTVLCEGTAQADAYKALNKMRHLTDAERTAIWNTKGWIKTYSEYKAEH